MPIDAARIFHGKIGSLFLASRPRLNFTLRKIPVCCNKPAGKQQSTFLSAENVQ